MYTKYMYYLLLRENEKLSSEMHTTSISMKRVNSMLATFSKIEIDVCLTAVSESLVSASRARICFLPFER